MPGNSSAFELGRSKADADGHADEGSPLLPHAAPGQHHQRDLELASATMSARPPRLHYLDYLRVFLTATVLVHHCFYIFWLGWWPFYGYWLPYASETIAVASWTLLSFNQAYFMGLFFLLAGHFSSPSLQHKGSRSFLADRATRLLVPAVAFEAVLAPLACGIARGVNSFDVPPGLSSSSSTYGWYWSQYTGFGANPTWFIFLLFFFDCGHACWHSCCPARPHNPSTAASSSSSSTAAAAAATPSVGPASGSSGRSPAPFTVSRTLAALACIAAALSCGCFLLRIWFPVGFWLPWGFNGLQPAYLVQYLAAYLLGIAAHRSDALARLPASPGPWLTAAALAWFALGWTAVLAVVGASAQAGAADPAAPLMGGWSGWAACYAAFEQVFAVLWSAGLLLLARQRCNTAPGRVWAALIHSAYTTYLLHPLVVYGLTRIMTAPALWPVTAGSILGHVLAECPLVLALTWALAIGVKALPGTGRVL